MAILDLNDFKAESAIPGLLPAVGGIGPANDAVRESVQAFIGKYEPMFLDRFYNGHEAERAEIEAYAALPEESRKSRSKNRLLGLLKVPLSHYVAFYYFRHCTVRNTPIGGVVLQGENGSRNNTSTICVQLWNQMADLCLAIYAGTFCIAHPDTEVFRHVNDFNL